MSDTKTATARRSEKICLAIGLTVALAAAIQILQVLPTFEDLYRSMQPKWPLLTWAVLRYRYLVPVLPLVVVGAWYAWPKTGNRALAVILLGTLGGALFIAFTWAMMYLPFFLLGA